MILLYYYTSKLEQIIYIYKVPQIFFINLFSTDKEKRATNYNIPTKMSNETQLRR